MNTDRLKVKALTKGDNPEWVEGYYRPPSHWVFTYGYIENRGGLQKIDVDTLCQCTGLEDSNDDLIYEGDEVVVKDFRPHDKAEYDPLAGVFDEYEDLQAFVEYRNGRHYICSPGYMLGLFGFQSTQMTLTGKNIHDPK